MANFKTVSTLVVDCSDWGFGPFEVLVIAEEGNLYSFFLRHPKYCGMHDMFSTVLPSDEEAAEMAYNNAPHYIPSFIEEVMCDD